MKTVYLFVLAGAMLTHASAQLSTPGPAARPGASSGVTFSSPGGRFSAFDIQVGSYGNLSPEQRAVVDAKILLWEARITAPGHVVTLEFDNADLGAKKKAPSSGVEPVLAGPGGARGARGSTLAETSDFTEDEAGRPTGAKITINNNPNVPWYTGLATPVPAGQYDLWTVINHEIVHALGFTIYNSRFDGHVVDGPGSERTYNPGGVPTATLTPESEGTHLADPPHAGDLMGPELPAGERRVPSQLDIDLLLHDVWCFLVPGSQFCPGDGVFPHTPCPCYNNNFGFMGGCYWGDPFFPEGGVLDAWGSSSIAANNTFLQATGISNNFGIFFGADNQVNGGNGNPLNDGLRCAGGGLVRLTPPTSSGGNVATTPAQVQALDWRAAPGVTRRYQYWFRTPLGPCGYQANLTNGYEISWTP